MSLHCPNPSCPDREASGGPGEYRDGIRTCPYCGTPLEPGPARGAGDTPASGTPEPAAHEATVFLARDATEADMIRGLLEIEGILAIARVRRGTDMPGLFSATWAPVPGQTYEILVSSRAREEARAVLEAAFGPDHPGLDVEDDTPGRTEF